MSTEYSFLFVLYELIVPEYCETSVSTGCIYVGLKKKSRGLWPRLLRDKHLKCPFLSTDFNRFEDALDSSSDDDEDDEHNKSPLHLMYMRKGSLSQLVYFTSNILLTSHLFFCCSQGGSDPWVPKKFSLKNAFWSPNYSALHLIYLNKLYLKGYFSSP